MKKNKISLVCILLLLMVTLVGCSKEEATKEGENPYIDDVLIENRWLYITESDVQTESDEIIECSFSEQQRTPCISKGGNYLLTGELNTTLVIDSHDEMVHLYLDDLSIHTSKGPAIEVKSASKVIMTLVEGSDNAMSDSAYTSSDEICGAIYSNSDLTINGTGSLVVSGYYEDAIHCKDVCKILGGTIQLRSKRCGIRANDGILLEPDSLFIESEKNGCKTTNAEVDGKGIIYISDGEIAIISGTIAICGASDLYIRENNVELSSIIDNFDIAGGMYVLD